MNEWKYEWPKLPICSVNKIIPSCLCGRQVNCTLPYRTVLCCTILYCTILYCTVLCYTVLYCTVLSYTILYCTVLNSTHHALEPSSDLDVGIIPQYRACSGVLEEHFGYAASPHTIQVLHLTDWCSTLLTSQNVCMLYTVYSIQFTEPCLTAVTSCILTVDICLKS